MSKPNARIERQSGKHEWVMLDQMRVRTGVAQREFKSNHPILRAEFKLERLHTPVVNKVGEWYWIVDGQHRIAALKQWLGDWQGQSLECLVYRGLSEQQEADLFRSLNDVKAVDSFAKFVVGLTAEYEDETNVAAIVRRCGLTISQGVDENAVGCVATLLSVYRATGMDGLSQTLEIAFGAFGKEGLEADMVRGIGLLPGRYNGLLDTKRMIGALSALRGGAGQVRSRAERLRHQFGVNKANAIAATCVEADNKATRKGKKLPSWWKSEASA